MSIKNRQRGQDWGHNFIIISMMRVTNHPILPMNFPRFSTESLKSSETLNNLWQTKIDIHLKQIVLMSLDESNQGDHKEGLSQANI
jgi:hypothetical protein